jgi:hypothetical protein
MTISIEQTNIRPLTDAELGVVSGGMTNAETPAGKAFISGFLAGGGTMGNPGTMASRWTW